VVFLLGGVVSFRGMIIQEGTAEDIHNWFLTEKTEEIVLCIFLGTRPDDVTTLSRLIDQAVHIDSIIGGKIGFLLCANNLHVASSVNSEGGSYHIIDAEYKKPRANPETAREFISRFNMKWLNSGSRGYHSQVSRALAKSTANLVPSFMELYGVERSELPCIITLFKGLEAFKLTKLPLNWSVDSLEHWLSDISDIVDRVERDLLMKHFSVWDISSRMARTNEYLRERNAKLEKVRHAVVGICSKYIADQQHSLSIISALTSAELNKSAKCAVVETLFERCPSSRVDSRWRKVYKLLERIDDLNSLELDTLDHRSLLSASERLNEELDKLRAISEAISELTIDGANGRTGSRRAVPRRARFDWETIERVNTATDIAEKTMQVMQVLTRLLS
jgi:hypothetical protein